MRQEHPDLMEDTEVFVREVRSGSILADLLPAAASLISFLDQSLIVEQFVRLYGQQLGAYFVPGGRLEDASKGELRDFMGQVAAIANSPNGKGAVRAITYEERRREVKAEISFDTQLAIAARDEIEAHKCELDAISSADHTRVLLRFKRSDIGSADVGVRSGERVIIDALSEKDFPLIYGADLAEQRIKDQMRNTDENIYHKGFVVDVNEQTKGGKTVAYAVVHVHQIIDLEDGG